MSVPASFRAAVLHEIGGPLKIETITTRPLKSEDVLVKVRASSLCHTDLEVIEGSLRFDLPVVPGHEVAGEVAAVGDAVSGLAEGDPVVLSWNPHCGHCYYCDHDTPILCESLATNQRTIRHFDGGHSLFLNGAPLGAMSYLGGFAEYVLATADSVVKVPADIPFDRACLIGCGVMTGVGGAINVADVAWGSVAMVIGCGAVGLSAIQGARMAGARTILAVDLDHKKLELARKLGATHLCHAGEDDPVAMVKGLTSGRGADYVFESAGAERAFQLSVEAARPGAEIVWLGKVDVETEVRFRWGTLMGERRMMRSSYGGARPHRDFPRLAQAYLDGRLKLDELITARISLDEINDGFDMLRRGDAIRTVITFDD